MTSIQSQRLPEAIQTLPGVSEPISKATSEAINQNATPEMTRVSAPNLASQRAAADVGNAFKVDLANNPTLVQALQAANMNPTPEGLVRISQQGRIHDKAFSSMIGSAKLAALADGHSPKLNQKLSSAIDHFIQSSDVRATDGPELAYLESRVMLEAQNNERTAAIKSLKEAVKAAESQLKDLQETQDLMERAYGDDGKVDSSSDDSKAAAAELEDRGFEMDNKTEAADSNNDGKISQTEQSSYNQNRVADQISETTAILADLRKQLERLENQPASGVNAANATASENVVDLIIKTVEDIQQMMLAKAQGASAGNNAGAGNSGR